MNRRVIFSLVLAALLGASSASAEPPLAPPPHLLGVWEGLAVARGAGGKVWREYVAFEFERDGLMNMANAREPATVQGRWRYDGRNLHLTVEGRPGATLDRLKVSPDRIVARLGYGQGQGVDIELHRVDALPSIPKLPDGAVSAASVTVDGVKLGESMAPLYGRRLYASPCDDDALPPHKLRVVVYAAQPCRQRQFSKGTSAVFFLDLDNNDPKGQAVRTVAWLGGTYFHDRSNFPIRIGTRIKGRKGAAKLAKTLGQTVERTMKLKRKSRLTVTTFTGAIHLLDDGRKIVGVVLGPMPSSTDNDLWGGVMQMWEKYTKPGKR